MSTFAERLNAFFNTQRDYSSYLEAKGYYADKGATRWDPTYPEDTEPQKRLGQAVLKYTKSFYALSFCTPLISSVLSTSQALNPTLF